MRKQAFRAGSATVAITLAIFCSYTGYSQTTSKQFLHDSQPPAVPHLSAIGRLTPATRLNLSIGLPLRNQSALDELIGQLYDPASPNYRHYLTPQQFTEQFGPAESDYQAVENFFRTNGFNIEAEYPNHVVLDVSGPVADIERVFHVTMRTYNHPRESRTFYAPDTEPSIDFNVPILHISGMDNYSRIEPRIRNKIILDQSANVSQTTTKQTGSGPGGGYMGKDFRNAYLPGVSLTGAGETLGLLELDGYFTNDIIAYTNKAGLGGVPIVNVPTKGVKRPGTPGNEEVALDIDMAMSIAPGLSKIVVYEEPTATFDSILSTMANDTVNSPQVFSCSWGNVSPGAPDTTAESLFEQMDAQGQSFFDATGDGDAFVGGIPFPSESTNITQAGATTLTTTGPGGAWVLETTWNWGGNPLGNPTVDSIGSSGGVSSNFSMPYWQQGMSWTANLGSPTMRNVPDVAMVGDNVFIVADNGENEIVGGTSCAAPEWASVTALADQQAAAKGHGTAGFINPVIYPAGKSANYTSDFDDITTGNNFWYSSTNLYPAVRGYDLCTGWGSPTGDNLIDLLAGVSDALAVAPGRGSVGFGAAGGPFNFSTQTFFLTNSGTASLNWSLINTSAWLTASTTGGTLTPGGPAATVTASLNAAAYNLPLGTYTASVLFSNATSHATRTRQFTLLVAQSSLQNGGFESTPFSLPYWAQSGLPATFISDFVDNGTTISNLTAFSGSYYCALATSNAVGYLSQTILTVPGQTYQLSFWLTNPTNKPTNQFFARWITSTTNTLLGLTNPPVFNWTNYVFYVTATGTNSVLQFAGRNDWSAFGLDAVSLVPIPSPNIRGATEINKSALSLTWNSQTNVVYQVQYSTNLVSSNWLNLSTNTAIGPTLTVTNPTSPDRYRFYRVLRTQ